MGGVVGPARPVGGGHMAFFFENLDLKTRECMIREIDLDLSMGVLFMSPRLRPGSEGLV